MSNANASSGDQFQDLAFPPDYPASVAFVLRKLKNQKDETDAVVNAVKARVTVLEGIAETLSGRMTAVETAAADRVKKSSIQSLDPSTVKLSPASIKEFLVTMVNAMKACLALALLVPALAFGGGKDIYGNDLARTNKLGYVDGDLTTVGDIADFGAASPSVITTVVEGIVHPWARAANPPAETDPTVPYWAKQVDPPAESDPTVKAWAKADNPPAETDPTVPAWAKAANPPASMPDNGLVLTNNGTTVKTKAGTEITASMVGAMPSSYTAPVTSVNTKTGDVTLNAADVGAIPSTKTTWLADDVRSSGGNVFVQTSNTGVQGGGTSKMMFFSGNSIFFKIMSGEAEGGWQNFVFPCYTGGSSKYLATTDTTVPTTRKVNNKPLSSDITLGASDVGAVPATRTVNNKALSSNISLSASDVGAATPEDVRNTAGYIASNLVDHTNVRFSNEVLSVCLNVDTNTVAILNEIASVFDGFPVQGTATTVGGLLAALASAIAWLKRNKLTKGMTNRVPDDPGVIDLFAKSDNFDTDHNLKNSKLQESVNDLIDLKVGTIDSALDALNGEVA